ncbi:MAG: CO dehydrogenase/acetyl-CoA synthase subunit delta [Methanosarcinaceae archaeon]|nr:CO dehydrogenase/acetyl-CoA synthase subunit delta [Methanosarcinaceae archaeon]
MDKTITLDDLEKILTDSLSGDMQDIASEALLSGSLEIDVSEIDRTRTPKAVRAVGEECLLLAKKFMNAAVLLGFEPDDELRALAGAGLVHPDADAGSYRDRLSETLAPAAFEPRDFPEFRMPVREVRLGAKRSEGGSRSKTITLGGEKTMPYFYDNEMPNRNYVTLDVFDMPVGLAKSVKVNYEDVMEDPAEWAEKAVNEFGADMVTIHLISTDPGIMNTSAKEAAVTVENILQAVDVPIVIGGSGNPEKDPEVLEKAAEAAEGERVLLASANLGMDYKRIADAAVRHGHAVLSWTQMDINSQKELNRKLIRQCGMSPDAIIMDPTTAALGYGLDYAYSNMERIRLAGLTGDEELAFPMSSGTTNAWGAREAWMIASPLEQDSGWGKREFRGPVWEAVTGLSLALAGNDLFMMMHPTAVRLLKNITQTLRGKMTEAAGYEKTEEMPGKRNETAGRGSADPEDDWLTAVFRSGNEKDHGEKQ